MFKKKGKFKIGDTVKYKDYPELEIIVDINSEGFISGKTNNSEIMGTHVNPKNYTLIKKGEKTMNQYDSLKQRIEKVTAWDKECDDILQEIDRDCKSSKPYSIQIYIANSCTIRILKSTNDEVTQFNYSSQCEKLEAFKKALMWLLDHSDIKQTIVGTKQQVKIEGKVYEAEIIKEA